MGEISSLKLASLLGNNIWTIGDTWLLKLSTQSLAAIRPFKVIIGPAEYQYIAAQIVTDPPPHFTGGTRHSGLYAALGVLQTSNRPYVGNNVKDDSPDHITYFQSSGCRFYDHHTIFFAF